MGENLADVLNSIEVEDDVAAPEEEDAFVDPEQAVITKVKRCVVQFWLARLSTSSYSNNIDRNSSPTQL